MKKFGKLLRPEWVPKYKAVSGYNLNTLAKMDQRARISMATSELTLTPRFCGGGIEGAWIKNQVGDLFLNPISTGQPRMIGRDAGLLLGK